MTYEEILERMRGAHSEAAGFFPEDGGDAGIRIRVFAGEVMNAFHALESLRDDAFPGTAAGEALENHAGQRGLFRRAAEPSRGTLTFSRETALPYAVEIPAGTVCAASGAGAEFETTEGAELSAGALSVTVPAKSVGAGKGQNAAVGAVDTLVTPPGGIERVTNTAPFTGGADAEDDASLRARLCAAFAALPNGVNSETYRRTALNVPGVRSANVAPRVSGAGSVGIYVYGNGEAVPEETLREVEEALSARREVGVELIVENAEAVPRRVTFYLDPAPGCAFEEAKALSTEAVERYFAGLGVGDMCTRAGIIAAVMGTGAAANCTLSESVLDYIAEPGQIVTAGEITVLRTMRDGE